MEDKWKARGEAQREGGAVEKGEGEADGKWGGGQGRPSK